MEAGCGDARCEDPGGWSGDGLVAFASGCPDGSTWWTARRRQRATSTGAGLPSWPAGWGDVVDGAVAAAGDVLAAAAAASAKASCVARIVEAIAVDRGGGQGGFVRREDRGGCRPKNSRMY